MHQRRRDGIGRQQVKSEGNELLEVGGGELLRGAAVIEFVERIAGPRHAAIEKVAGVGGAAVVGQFGMASVQRERSGRSGGAALKQTRIGAGKAEQVENIRLRTVWNAAHRVGQLVQRDADEEVRID